MPRMPRVVVPGIPHHVTQRGNRSQQVFFRDEDRLDYLGWLAEYAALHKLEIAAYCLMPNHIHLIATPTTDESLAATLRALHARYAQSINRREGWTGHLWQGRHYSCPLDDAHFYSAVRYVERNPVRAGMVASAADYRWSSAAAHCGQAAADLPLAGPLPDVDDWETYLLGDHEESTSRLRECTNRGLPFGGQEFVERLEAAAGRRLVPGQPGRPKMEKQRRGPS